MLCCATCQSCLRFAPGQAEPASWMTDPVGMRKLLDAGGPPVNRHAGRNPVTAAARRPDSPSTGGLISRV